MIRNTERILMPSLPHSVGFPNKGFLLSMTGMEVKPLHIGAVDTSMRYVHLLHPGNMQDGRRTRKRPATSSTHALFLQYLQNEMNNCNYKPEEGDEYKATPFFHVLDQTYSKVDKEVIIATPENVGVDEGCTAVTVLLRIEGTERVLYCANVGDSHAVLCQGGTPVRLTTEHTAQNSEEVLRVNNANSRALLKQRVLGILEVTRSLGDYSFKESLPGVVLARPDKKRRELSDADEFIILASDGVSSTLPPPCSSLRG